MSDILTYTNQPDNVGAWKLGRAASNAAKKPGGDYIDGGLELLKQLLDEGFGIVVLEKAVNNEPI